MSRGSPHSSTHPLGKGGGGGLAKPSPGHPLLQDTPHTPHTPPSHLHPHLQGAGRGMEGKEEDGRRDGGRKEGRRNEAGGWRKMEGGKEEEGIGMEGNREGGRGKEGTREGRREEEERRKE